MRIFAVLILTYITGTIYSQTPGLSADSVSTTSKKIPDLMIPGKLLDKLNDTVWLASDLKKNQDFYIFFKNQRQSVAAVPRGQAVGYPQQSYPLKYMQEGSEANSAIYLVITEDKLLYYSFRLITPYYLAVSPGYETIDPLTTFTLQNYFNTGYILQLVY
ncbi:MAG: hypothetical protein ACRCTQ_04055 [Brevinemataceae bacterium]